LIIIGTETSNHNYFSKNHEGRIEPGLHSTNLDPFGQYGSLLLNGNHTGVQAPPAEWNSHPISGLDRTENFLVVSIVEGRIERTGYNDLNEQG
jgi:hypothetical protein